MAAAAAASGGGGSSRPLLGELSPLGFESRTQIFETASAVLRRLEPGASVDRCLSCICDASPARPAFLDERIAGVFFRVAYIESRVHSDASFEGSLQVFLASNPAIATSFQADPEVYIKLKVTDAEGASEEHIAPIQFLSASGFLAAAMRDHKTSATLSKSKSYDESLDVLLPDGLSLEEFRTYLTIYQTRTFPEVDFSTLCKWAAINNYFQDEDLSIQIQEKIQEDLKKEPSLEKLYFLIETLRDLYPASLAFIRTLNTCLNECIKQSIKAGTFPALMEGLAELNLSEALPGVSPSLSLTHMAIEEGLLDSLARTFPGMRQLDLYNTDMTDAHLTHLTRLKDLTYLDLSLSKITGAGLDSLVSLTHLESLTLTYCCEIANAKLSSLVGLKALKNLNLSWCWQITDAGFAFLSELKTLRQLDLEGNTQITNATLVSLTTLNALTFLNLSLCSRLTDTGLFSLEPLRALTQLNLSACCKITDTGLISLSKLTALTQLNLSKCPEISRTGLAYLTKLENLTHLDLSDCYKITDTGLVYLARLPSLQVLNLSRCYRITDTGLSYLARSRTLTNLDLSGCDLITPHGIYHLEASRFHQD